jgi:dTDP-4-dehydrorhamnose reductase
MKICIVGATGIIGQALVQRLRDRAELLCLSSADYDLRADLAPLGEFLLAQAPDVIINATALTQIDYVETHKIEGFLLNTLLPYHLAELCQQCNAHLIHFSSDNVFDGLKSSAYTETDALTPLNYYGHTKAQADITLETQFAAIATVLRISGIYSPYRKNFLTSFLNRVKEHDSVQVVDDIFVAPTPDFIVANAVGDLIQSGQALKGTYHLSAGDSTSWFGFSSKLLESLGIRDKQLVPISSDTYKIEAKRPKRCILDSSKLEQHADLNLPSWEEALQDFVRFYHLA